MTLDARYPVALLPVRLETRLAGSLLRVRIFPDEIFADTHEAGLTPEERADGTAYVAAMQAGIDAEKDAWRNLVARWTAPRAAFIALSTIGQSGETRAESWSRAARAVLPDRWVIRAYQGSAVFTKTSAAVTQPIALTFSPTATDADRVPLSDGLSIDRDLQWTVDFAAAEAAGMAVTIDLAQPDPPSQPATPPGGGVDLIVAVGISESATAGDGAVRLRTLLDAQHYTRGLAFLGPGTPTNNTPTVPAAFPPDDAGGAVSFAIERGAPLVTPASSAGSNGLLFARALGLPLATGEHVAGVEHVDGAGVDGDAAAAAMNDALWPATLGYFLEQMMRYDAATVASARQFFVDHVRAGGPMPAFRVGRVPYGLLPAVSLTRFAPDTILPRTARMLRDAHFVPASAQVPHVSASSADPDGDLLKVLAMDASCRVIRMRILLGQQFTSNTANWLGATAALEAQSRHTARATAASALLNTVGIAGDTRIGTLDGGPVDELIHAPLVTSAPLSEEFGLEGPAGTGVNYIRWLHDNAIGNTQAIKNDALPGTSRPLLYRVLRHALLAEMDRLAFHRLVAANVVAAADRVEVEMVRLAPSDARLTTYERIDRALTLPVFAGDLSPYLARLATLAALPTAELDRRFGETLDACSHRLDAWITALATERLSTMRTAAADGCHVGGFGWVENVRAADSLDTRGGFIHAPSATHASAAAILRNGFLSRGGEGSAYAVDLSSARVRAALTLIDGTRQGAPLSGLLGYQFERDLHERQLEPLIAPLRNHFPLVAGKTSAGDGPTELVGARNVVDGLKLRQAWNEKKPPFFGTSDLPPLTDSKLQSFHAALDALNDAVDGVADVLTAEAVFQAVQGNPMAAAATLDTMASGVTPPRPEVVRTPFGGTSFTQRLIVALGAGAAPAPDGWGTRTPRATAEPSLDDWVGTLLGAPAGIGCTVHQPDGSTRVVTLASLGLRPLDVVALASTPPSGAGATELDGRVLAAASAAAGSHIDYAAGGLAQTFAVVLELARTIGDLLAVARPLMPADLVAPADAGSATVRVADAQEAATRARAAVQQLLDATQALEQAQTAVAASLAANETPDAGVVTTLRSALVRAASFGALGAYPAPSATAADLAAAGDAIVKELGGRSALAPALDATDPVALQSAAIEAMHAVFGRDFLFLPKLVAPLAAPLAASAELVGDAQLPRRALQQLARVRPRLMRWRAMWLYGQALGAVPPAFEVVQYPKATAWAGRAGAAIAPGTVSIIVQRPTGAAAESGWAGLVIDEWNETVPSDVQKTSVSFRYETPVAEAPQAVLVAVPPDAAAAWDTDTLIDTVRETLLLARIRGVDGSLLEGLRPFLPAICLTGNTANEAVSTDFLKSLVAEATIRSL
jgi:hypothetical protein